MKHKTEILIDADRNTVWRAFDDPNNKKQWQPTLRSFIHKTGTPGQADAVSELIYDENGREVIVTERITARREPSFLGGTYESKWGTFVIFNHFEETEDGRTLWIGHTKYAFKGIMKLMALFMWKSICKRSDADMNRFKLLIETQIAGSRS